MNNKLISMILGATVAIIVVASVLIPIIVDVNDSERTVINNPIGNSNYSIIKDASNEDNHLITWTKGANVMRVDDNDVPVGLYNSYMVQSDKIGVNISTAGAIGYATADTPAASFNADITQVTVTISGKTINLIADGANPINVTVTDVSWYALPDQDGKYKMGQQPNSDDGNKWYLNSIDQIYGYMNVSTNSLGFVTFGNGVATLPDGTKVNMESNAVDVDEYTDLIEISRYKGYYLSPEYLTNLDGTVISPYFMLIPTEVSAHTEQQSSVLSLINVIPILILTAIIFVVAASIRSRY